MLDLVKWRDEVGVWSVEAAGGCVVVDEVSLRRRGMIITCYVSEKNFFELDALGIG